MTDDADISNPPQVGPNVTMLPASEAMPSPPPVSSNIVPAPKTLGRTDKAQPAEAIPEAAGTGSAGVSWITEDAASSASILATTEQIINSSCLHLHAYGPRDISPYTPVALDVGGVPATQHTAFQRSLLTAKDRLRHLRKISLSSTDKAKSHEFTVTMSQSSIDEDDLLPFPASASMLGAQQGSTRDMGSLEWLNMSSGPPKATHLAGHWPFLLKVLLILLCSIVFLFLALLLFLLLFDRMHAVCDICLIWLFLALHAGCVLQ